MKPSQPFNLTDPSQNYIESYLQPLDALFHPKSIALVGAKDTPGSVGNTILKNLLSATYKGKIYPVNPKRSEVLGLKCYAHVSHIPEPIDLAIIVTPAATVPKIVEECVAVGVKSAIIISAGFKELGAPGLKLEEEILLHARKGNMPIVGPNCLGVMNPIIGLNATFARGIALPGNIAFISQSGAMCTAVLDWSLQEKVGFSAFVSIGSMADVNWGTLIDYLGNDPNTQSLLLYMETIGDARAFMTAAREVALEKPIIVIKAGRSLAAAKAAASHTGSLAGSDEVFDAALERIGVLRVDSIAELFSMASVLARQPRPKGPHLSIITNAGGPAVLATDATVLNHAELTSLSHHTLQNLDKFLPEAWSHSNPIDILGDAGPGRYADTINVLAQDKATDGILVILSPQDMTDATATAKEISNVSVNIPILASWMGGETVAEGREVLAEAKIPNFEYPDDAAKAFAKMWSYSRNLKNLYEIPLVNQSAWNDSNRIDNSIESRTARLLHQVQSEKRDLLTEYESKRLLDFYQIPVVKTEIAKSIEEAVNFANQMKYPIVLKLFSETITHKSDIGGVKLNLSSAEEVVKAFNEIRTAVFQKAGEEHFQGVTVQKMIRHEGYELILGSTTDPQFGPVILFGMGGQLVEVFKDRALAIPPLTINLARMMMEKTKIYEALLGVRGRKPINMEKLEEVLVNFSRMIVENRRIKECDINPLIVSDEEILALDARVVLHDRHIDNKDLPHLSIRPYPYNYIVKTKLKNELDVILRPIKPEDESALQNFHSELSEKSVYQRFFDFVSLDHRIAHERLIRICFNDYDREWAIVAEIGEQKFKRIIGIGRLTRIPGTNYAQLKMTIIDAYHHLGIGTELMKQLIYIAERENIKAIDAHILEENVGMLHLCNKFGFKIIKEKERSIVHVRWANPDVIKN
jgi:acetyltransferase